MAISLSGSAVSFSLTEGEKKTKLRRRREAGPLATWRVLLRALEWSGFLMPFARSLCSSIVDDCCFTRYTASE